MANRGPVANILDWVFTGAAAVAVTFRLISRLKIRKTASWDDLTIVIALSINIATSAITSYAISLGLGQHITALPLESAVQAGKWTVIADTVGVFSFTVPKLAVAILLTRILTVGKISHANLLLLYMPAVALICYSVAAAGVGVGQCQPPAAQWNPSVEGSCMSPHVYEAIGLSIGPLSAAADFFYGIYPTLFISKLNMPVRKRIYLSMMLGLGVVGGAIAIWKVTQFPAVSKPGADITYAAPRLIYATMIEANVLIIAACVPTVGPLIEKFNSGSKLAVSNSWNRLHERLRSRNRRKENYDQFSSGYGSKQNRSDGSPDGNSSQSLYGLQRVEVPGGFGNDAKPAGDISHRTDISVTGDRAENGHVGQSSRTEGASFLDASRNVSSR